MLVITWYDNGKHKSNSSVVSIAEKDAFGLSNVDLSIITGVGGCYGNALEDFIYNFDMKLGELKAFREMLDEMYQFQTKVKVDCFGKEIK